MDLEIYGEIDKFLANTDDKTLKRIKGKLDQLSHLDKKLLEKSQDIKRLESNVYEVIIGPWRLLGCLIGMTLHLTVVFRKKTQKTPSRYIYTARKRGLEIEKIFNK